MEMITIILMAIVQSAILFIFWVVKGGFNKKVLYTDNVYVAFFSSIIAVTIYSKLMINIWVHLFFIIPLVIFSLFFFLFLYRFFRNPNRIITASADEFVAPADGRVIYIKELEQDQIPVSVKRLRLSKIDEITKTKILEEPCYLVGIAMTLFDVHINRAPINGKVILVKHTPGEYMGLNKPRSTIVNERNTIVIQREDDLKVGVVQIAARFVRRCIVSVNEGEYVKHGGVIGKIRFGSQADLIIPRSCEIHVREGDQVYAGKSIIAKLIQD